MECIGHLPETAVRRRGAGHRTALPLGRESAHIKRGVLGSSMSCTKDVVLRSSDTTAKTCYFRRLKTGKSSY